MIHTLLFWASLLLNFLLIINSAAKEYTIGKIVAKRQSKDFSEYYITVQTDNRVTEVQVTAKTYHNYEVGNLFSINI